MSKKFNKPSARDMVADPDKIIVNGFKNEVSTEGLRSTNDIKVNPEYKRMYTQVRVDRAVAEKFKEYCKGEGIRFYGNYINAVLKAYINGDLKSK